MPALAGAMGNLVSCAGDCAHLRAGAIGRPGDCRYSFEPVDEHGPGV